MTDLRSVVPALVASFSTEARRTVRDRRTLVLIFLMPVVIATIVVYAIGSTDEEHGPVVIGWVPTSDHGSVEVFRREVVDRPQLAGEIEWRRFDSERAAIEAVAEADPGAAIVVETAPTAGAPAALRLLANEDPVAAGVAATVIDRFRVGHAVATMAAASGSETPAADTTGVPVIAPTGASLDAAVHWGPMLGVFFVLLAMGHAAHRQVEDRHRGIVGRLASVPCGPGPVMIGRAVTATTVGAASLLLMAATTRIVFGRAWGPWPQLVVVALATALAVAGIGGVIAAWSTTPGRAQSLTAVVAFALAIAGGGFSPLGSGGEPSGVTRWLPTSLSYDAFGTATTTARWGELLVPLVALGTIGVVLCAIGSAQARRSVA